MLYRNICNHITEYQNNQIIYLARGKNFKVTEYIPQCGLNLPLNISASSQKIKMEYFDPKHGDPKSRDTVPFKEVTVSECQYFKCYVICGRSPFP